MHLSDLFKSIAKANISCRFFKDLRTGQTETRDNSSRCFFHHLAKACVFAQFDQFLTIGNVSNLFNFVFEVHV